MGCLSQGVPTLQTFRSKPGGPGEDRALLPQPPSFRSLRPAAAHLREGGGTGDPVQEAVAGRGRQAGEATPAAGFCFLRKRREGV